MKIKKWWIIGLLVLLIIAISSFWKINNASDLKTLIINNKEIRVKVADTPLKQMRGLMFVRRLPKNQGMLFIFDSVSKHSFWMKNTYIPLDIIWLNQDKKVVHIEHSAPPCKLDPCQTYFPPTSSAKYVLELGGGWAVDNNLSIEDTVEFVDIL